MDEENVRRYVKRGSLAERPSDASLVSTDSKAPEDASSSGFAFSAAPSTAPSPCPTCTVCTVQRWPRLLFAILYYYVFTSAGSTAPSLRGPLENSQTSPRRKALTSDANNCYARSELGTLSSATISALRPVPVAPTSAPPRSGNIIEHWATRVAMLTCNTLDGDTRLRAVARESLFDPR